MVNPYWQSVVCGAYYEFWSLISIFFLSNCRWSWLGQGNSVWQNLREIWIHSHVLGRFVAKRRSDFSMNLTHLHDLDCESWVMLENWSPPLVFNLTELRVRLFLVAYNNIVWAARIETAKDELLSLKNAGTQILMFTPKMNGFN